MKVVCCVCKKDLGEKEGPKDMISHGFCDPCLKVYKAKMMADMEEMDKSTDVPVVSIPEKSQEALGLEI